MGNDIIVDGMTRVSFVPLGSGDPSAFTVAQVNAGTLLQERLVPTGLEGFESSGADVDNTSLASKENSNLPGRGSWSGTGLVCKKQESPDPVFSLLSVRGTNGHIVIRDVLDEGAAWAASQPYEAYLIRTGDWSYLGRGEANSLLRYRVLTPIQKRIRGILVA